MSTGKGLFAGLAMIAAAILIVGLSNRPIAAEIGSWQISSAAGQPGFAAKINRETGETWLCYPGPNKCVKAISQ